jgi:hypothetical protein
LAASWIIFKIAKIVTSRLFFSPDLEVELEDEPAMTEAEELLRRSTTTLWKGRSERGTAKSVVSSSMLWEYVKLAELW